MKLKNIFKNFQLFLEYIIFISLKKILKMFSFDLTSKLGSSLIGIFGKFSRYSSIISSNLSLLKLNDQEIKKITQKNLENTGRVFFEFFNLNKFDWQSLIIKNEHYLDTIKHYKGSKIFLSAHIGNWEITRNYLLHLGFVLHSVYRQANNSKIDEYIQKNRIKKNAYFYRKGSDSAKNMIKALKNNDDLALLVDQRDSSGPLINFFGKKAYSTDGFANLAIKYQTILCPVYTIRNEDGSFKFIYDKPLPYKEFRDLNPKELTQKIYYEYFEKWIKKHPEQWLWAHDRWRL